MDLTALGLSGRLWIEITILPTEDVRPLNGIKDSIKALVQLPGVLAGLAQPGGIRQAMADNLPLEKRLIIESRLRQPPRLRAKIGQTTKAISSWTNRHITALAD